MTFPAVGAGTVKLSFLDVHWKRQPAAGILFQQNLIKIVKFCLVKT